jgi:tetratricopeptide (TPR) repeat protein
MALNEGRPQRGKWTGEPRNAFAELCLVEATRLAGPPRREALRAAARACDEALRCNPAWLAEAQRLHGTLAWLAGDRASARARWEKSRETAEKLGLAVERARTLLEMGDRLADVALVAEATRVFERTGARVYLASGLHARARMELESGADAGSTLQRYDQAIALLAEVKAEYELAVASAQRARLHAQLGHQDQARADLATARSCFAMVGAAQEQAAVELEATALAHVSPERTGSAGQVRDLMMAHLAQRENRSDRHRA